ncbi:N-methyl-L-tryptophan oxidase [Nitriliruptor alkaliphilus]|uniref:N-methyl-L-tryptophan oxidase n=1 Tax=Nitriliruptor alkaliphilus TaxID=427918 RepID=UPI000697AAA3|nr:N-methyl-L-tryptophan oxidase [Nitriliruptor alkaliphilus]
MGSGGDVAVIGVGSIGSMALWRLAAAGLSVHGFERFGVPHDRSAAGGETRMFRTTSPREPHYVPFAVTALERWGQLETDSGRQLLTRGGELVISPPDDATFGSILASIRTYELDHELLDARQIRARFPPHRVDPDDRGILDLNAGFLRSELAVLAAAERATRLGAVLHTGAPVTDVAADGEGVTVAWGGRHLRFEQAIVAAGPWTSHLAPDLAAAIEVRRPIQAWFAVDDPARYAPERFPTGLRLGPDALYVFPSLDGASVKVGVGGEHNRHVADPDRLDRSVDHAEVAHISERVRRRLPGLHPDPLRAAAYMDGYTPDHQPIIGRLPGAERIVVLGGFSGHGFKYAPAFGEAGAELVADGATTLDISPFAPDRLAAASATAAVTADRPPLRSGSGPTGDGRGRARPAPRGC